MRISSLFKPTNHNVVQSLSIITMLIVVSMFLGVSKAEAGQANGRAWLGGAEASPLNYHISWPDTVTKGVAFTISASACGDDQAAPFLIKVGYNVVSQGSNASIMQGWVINTNRPNFPKCEYKDVLVTLNEAGTFNVWLNAELPATWSQDLNTKGTIRVINPVDGACPDTINNYLQVHTCKTGNPYNQNLDDVFDTKDPYQGYPGVFKWGCKSPGGGSDTGKRACVLDIGNCTGSLPAHAVSWDDIHDENDTMQAFWSNPARDYSLMYSDSDTDSRPCEFKCEDRYTWNPNSQKCESQTFSCIGTAPAGTRGTTRYDSEEETGLNQNVSWTYSSSDTDTKCQYHCDGMAGYTTYNNGSNPPTCSKPPANGAPTANAGRDRIIYLPQTRVGDDGSSASDDGSYTIKWNRVSVSPVAGAISNDTTVNPTFTGMYSIGVYTYRMAVTDNQGLQDFDDMTVTVLPDPNNNAPTANAGYDQTITQPDNDAVSDRASASDTDGTITILWTEDSRPNGAPASSISDSTIENPTFTNLLFVGEYVFKMTVTDDDGAIMTDKVIITVVPPKTDGVCGAAIYTCDAGNPINNDGSQNIFASNGGIDEYRWGCAGLSGGDSTLGNECVYDIPNCEGSLPPNTEPWNVDGVWDTFGVVSDTVKSYSGVDNLGTKCEYKCQTGYERDISTQTCEPPSDNSAPTAYAGEDTIITKPIDNYSINDATASDPEGSVTIRWTQLTGPDGVSALIDDNTILHPTFSNMKEVGNYKFQLSVTDHYTGPAGPITVTDEVVITVKEVTTSGEVDLIPQALSSSPNTINLDDLLVISNFKNINGSSPVEVGDKIPYEFTIYYNKDSDVGTPDDRMSDVYEAKKQILARGDSENFQATFSKVPPNVLGKTHHVCVELNKEGTYRKETTLNNNKMCKDMSMSPQNSPPTLSIWSDDKFIRSGEGTKINLTIDTSYPLQCKVLGQLAVGEDSSLDSITRGITTKSVETAVLNSTSEYKLVCTDKNGTEVGNKATTVEVIPDYQER
ncbi:Ig-like domain-containing protein [Candidatus Nomurabacteria bacterium]|nr:Ig-like domain-containing protein [Candidatus Nomurabacteria bacterium]